MTIRAIMDAVKPTLADMLGENWQVAVSDDEWTMYNMLAESPGGVRCIFSPEQFLSGDGGPYRGMHGELHGRLIVQIRRGMERDEAAPLGTLFDAEERARRALMGLAFQIPGDPDWPQDWTEQERPPHTELGQFVHRGTFKYTPPFPDLVIEHPAREIRWSLPMMLRLAKSVQRIDLPLSAGN